MELKRVWSPKTIAVLLGITLVNLVFFVYSQFSAAKSHDFLVERDNRLQLYAECNGKSTEENSAYLKALEERLFGEQRRSENKTQLRVVRELEEKITYIEGYHDYVLKVLESARNIKKFPIFSGNGATSAADIEKTLTDYERVLGVETTFENDKAVEAFLMYNYVYYLCAAMLLPVLYNMIAERDVKMWGLVHTTAKGRAWLGIKRIFVLCATSFLVLLVNSLLIMGASAVLYGGSRLSAPIQNIAQFKDVTLPCTQLQYLFLNFGFAWLVLTGIAAVVWVLFVIIRSRSFSLVIVGLLTGLEVFLYNRIDSQSYLRVLREINLVKLLDIKEILSRYNNVQAFGYIFSNAELLVFCLLAVLFVCALISVVFHSLLKPDAPDGVLLKLWKRFSRKIQSLVAELPLTFKEIYKLFFTGKALWTVAIMALLTAYFCAGGLKNYTAAELQKDELYLEAGGKEYDAILKKISAAREAYEQAQQEAEAVSEKYNRGEVSLLDLMEAVEKVQYAAPQYGYYDEFQEKAEYLQHIRQEYGVNGYMLSDRGYEGILGKNAAVRELICMVILITGINLIISNAILLEYRTGMKYIIAATVRGRGWLLCRKICAAAVVATGLFVLVYGINYGVQIGRYGLPYLKAPVMSLTFMEGRGAGFTIGGWILLGLACRLLAALAAAGAALAVSRCIGKKGNLSLIFIVTAAEIGVLSLVML